jgi:NitT/TauT family transport system ATP-binding protein
MDVSPSLRPGAGTATGRGPAIVLQDVIKQFQLSRREVVTALDRVDLTVEAGEFVAVIGPSGCGKSSLLRLIAALDRPTSGRVLVDDADPEQLARAHRVGVAFQDHSLLPWLTARGNIALPYRLAGRRPDHSRVRSLLELMGIEAFADARPRQLSTGMRQRVAIARAIVLGPSVLLLDEPFASLDEVTRRRLHIELQNVWLAERTTTLLVTHSVAEAAFLADRVIVLSARPGRVVREYRSAFERPRTTELRKAPAFHAMVDEIGEFLDGAAAETR